MMNVANVGEVRAVTATVLTNKGVIVFLEYAKESDIDKYSSLFEALPRKIKLGAGLVYKPMKSIREP